MAIQHVWAKQSGEYFCICTKSPAGWKEHFFKRSELMKGVPTFLEANKDKDVYACPHGFTRPERKKEYAVLPKLLWADLDGVDPRQLTGVRRPTMAWESSPGRFVGLWLTDKVMTEELNRRLTYALGADKGGWDLTQVLRLFPGAVNYKYPTMPKVRLLWADGDSVEVRELERALPAQEEIHIEGDASAVYKQYEKKMPHWLRRELLKGKPTIGQRSEMLWKLGNELLELGLSRDECFLLIKASPWNKFAGRRNEDDQLTRELDKALNQKVNAKAPEPAGGTYEFLARSMEEVEEENIRWIWYPYLARGELSILEGDPGLGKSYLAQMVAAAFVDGKKLPSVKDLPPTKGKVAYFDMENSPGSVTKKRLKGNGCVNMRDYFQDDQPFSIDDEEVLAKVYTAIERVRPVLIVFDTINTYLGSANTGNASETTQAFSHFKQMAVRFDCAVLVLRHLTKGNRERALYRGQGSIAFSGLARSVMTVGVDPDDDDVRVMAVTKLNIGKIPQALTYEIRALPDTLKEQDRSVLEWGEFVDYTSDDILAAPDKSKKDDEKDACEEFIKSELEGGKVVLKSKLMNMASARNLSEKVMLKVAKSMVKIGGAGDTTTWQL